MSKNARHVPIVHLTEPFPREELLSVHQLYPGVIQAADAGHAAAYRLIEYVSFATSDRLDRFA